MIRKILVPVRGDGKGDNVVAHAAALAHRTKGFGHLVITHCRARPQDLMPYGIAIPKALQKLMIEQATQLADQEELGIIGEIEVLAQKLDLEVSKDHAGDQPTVEFVEATGRQVDVIRRYGRLSDIIAVAKPDRDRNLGTNSLMAALFHSGRPVLMCPETPTPPTRLGDKLTIAWNGSLEATRAVTMALPMLRDASTVTILSSGSEPDVASADELLLYLAAQGVSASIERFEPRNGVGKGLLDLSAELGADALIMGAYGDSHERELVFGGNTQHIVDNAKMPVILVH